MSTNRIIPAVLSDRDGMAVLGRTKHDLMGIRYENEPGGATPPAAPAEPPAAPPAAPPAPTIPAPAPPADAAPPAPAAPAPINYKGDPDEYVRELRAENKTAREAREAAESASATLQAERDAAATARDSLARENKLLLIAPDLGAKAAALLDSSSFMKTFADVDLSNEEAVKAAITDALGKNPAFKAGPALPPSSGGGHQGGNPPATTPTLEGAVQKALGG